MTFAQICYSILERAAADFHAAGAAPVANPYDDATTSHILYDMGLIAAEQWHLLDALSGPEVDTEKASALNRQIYRLNEERADMALDVDTTIRQAFSVADTQPDAVACEVTPGWLLDRLSIMAQKIYHMEHPHGGSADHEAKIRERLEVLQQQRAALMESIDNLIDDLAHGLKYIKPDR